MNNNDNELERYAIEKIRRDQRFRPNCNVIIGPTGPTGPAGGATGSTGPTGATGATARFNKSSNKIIHNFKQIPFKYKQKQVI